MTRLVPLAVAALLLTSPALADQARIDMIRTLDELVIPDPDDPDSILTSQPGAACEAIKEIVSTGIAKNEFLNLVDPDFMFPSDDEPEIERPTLLEIKPLWWKCDVLPGEVDVVCEIRKLKDPAPGLAEKRVNELAKLIPSCVDAKAVGYRGNSSFWREGRTWWADGNVNIVVVEGKREDVFNDGHIIQYIYLTFNTGTKR